MTEKQWLTAKSPDSLIDLCRDRRKLRLLACACARRMLAALPGDPAFEAIIDAAETYADNAATRPLAVAARKPLRDAAKRLKDAKKPEPLAKAVFILTDLTNDVIEGFTAGIANSSWALGHPNAVAKTNVREEKAVQALLLRDIFGNLFRPVEFDPEWRTSTAVDLAHTAYNARHFGALPILADALQDAGCEDDAILRHCRDEKQVHVRGCWVVDLVLGKS
ncbi:hypothetical protein [Limnoglobus roseus]|uniref:SMI1/KNR4 family protein n=1 Tax=Limnoglobus roseus TaxID=2598579 RepID=A0A5C1AGM0_9BACT|nr:hypothetical protein [Limnoglobus roseus]QEL17297.1 hypothetical protein PX52LOC_04280 [Limnoglobus roseus]